MKKNIFVFISIVFILSCETTGNSTSGGTNNKTIREVSAENTWILGSWRVSPYGGGVSAGTDLVELVFNRNGTGRWTQYAGNFSNMETLAITFSINGNSLIIDFVKWPSSTMIFTIGTIPPSVNKENARSIVLYGSNTSRDAINMNYVLSNHTATP